MSNEIRLAAIKLDSGEEIICYVVDAVDRGLTKHLVIRDPLKVEYVHTGRKSYKFSPWFLFATSREHEIDMNKIFAINGVYDDDVKEDYTKTFHLQLKGFNGDVKGTSGYVGSVNKFRKLLEKLYKEVPSKTDESMDP